MRTRDAVVVDGVVVVVVGVVVVGVVGVVVAVAVAVAVAAFAVVAGVVFKGIADNEAAEFAPDDADGVSRRAAVVSGNVDAAPVETDALSPALPAGCKVDCGDIKISTDIVVSVSSSALRLAGLGSLLSWVVIIVTVSEVTGSSIDSLLLLPTNFGVAASKIPFVFPAELAVNFRVVSFFNAMGAADPTGFRFGSRFVVHEFLPQHWIIVLRLTPLFLPAAILV
jgi:hypothetical protein